MLSTADLLNFTARPRIPVIRQSEAAECGLACLAMVAAFHGYEADLNSLRARFQISMKGTSLRGLIAIAGQLGLSSRALRLEPDHLAQLRLPAIVHWDMSHFVVLVAVRRGRVVIHDPALGRVQYTMDELSDRMTGVALELTPTAAFERKRTVTPLRLSPLIGRITGFRRSLVQAIILSALLQLCALGAPFYLQVAVDDAVVKGDGGLLTALALGFGLLMAINVATTTLRSLVLVHLGNILSFQMVVRLFHHLVRLPLPYFERRHIGDLISRFSSTQPIRDLLSDGIAATLVDGVMAIATLALILVYSVTLALIAVAAIGLYAALRFATFPVLRERNAVQIQAKAKQDSSFIETIRAIQSIKLFGREAERESVWQNRYAGAVNAGARLARLQTLFKTLNDLIFGVENIASIYIGARLALDGTISIGMLYAYLSYKGQFLDKVGRLVDRALDLRMLDLHLDRLADIALAEREAGYDQPATLDHPLRGALALRGVSYRYADTEPFVLDGVDLTVEPGSFVAITGPSGGGKTTLLKVMLGLFQPTAGDVLLDGYPLSAHGMQAVRSQIGVVMQDDQLLSGSIGDNIAFFDVKPDMAWVQTCAGFAALHDDIMRMPMGYNTLIGDMGTTLSGGQRQRLLLARALYRRPRILVLDEGTSHLDPALEAAVNAALSALNITRIIVAHRPQTVAAAEKIYYFHQGKLIPVQHPGAVETPLAQAVG